MLVWQAGVPDPADVPLSVRRSAITASSSVRRAMEEICLLKALKRIWRMSSFLHKNQLVPEVMLQTGSVQYMQVAGQLL